jgi:hypothetical protein
MSVKRVNFLMSIAKGGKFTIGSPPSAHGLHSKKSMFGEMLVKGGNL